MASRVGLLGSRPARSATELLAPLASLWRWLCDRVLRAHATAPRHAAVQMETPRFEIDFTPTNLRQDDTRALGTHLLVELYGCEPRTLERVHEVANALVRAAHASHAQIVSHFFHEFEPYGVSGVVVIEESHYTIHTWPEHRYAAVDLFYCSESVQAERALEVLREAFKPERVEVVLVRRGTVHRTPG
ncbi:S-adenosylmethionine decarboxylase proenzyme [bacterium HR15]|nr:S-adenosylmethionine decarboxylase proenzyme [bacterium HR15]